MSRPGRRPAGWCASPRTAASRSPRPQSELRGRAQEMTGLAEPAFEVDLFSPEVIANPHALYKEMRDKHPVYYNRDYDTFFFSRFEDVWEVLRVGDNALLATETNLPTPEYLRAQRNAGAPPFASI